MFRRGSAEFCGKEGNNGTNRREVFRGALLSAGAISAGSAMAQEVESLARERRQKPAPHESYPAADLCGTRRRAAL